MRKTHFLALLFAPLPQSSSSAATFFWFSTAAFAAAASAFFALPATFLVFSPAAFFPAITVVGVRECTSGQNVICEYLGVK